MDIVLYVPGMPFTPESLARGQSLGGSESAGYYLARELAVRGHRVSLFCGIDPAAEGAWEGVRYHAAGRPSEAHPLGEAFERHMAGTPCDVLIGQRVPHLFRFPSAAKLHFWWTHDLALKRHQPALARQAWNLDGIFCVSETHRRQVAAVYGLPEDFITLLPNGVDHTLFAQPVDAAAKQAGRVLFYSSRPERGLAHLVGRDAGEDSIMARLLREDPGITLQVCGYDNTTPELAGLYARLRARCEALPSVQWLGALGKAALAARMQTAWLHVYPTTFEEVSCITAMEAQCAGTPVLTSPLAALPETLAGGGARWLPLRQEDGEEGPGAIEPAAFAREILALRDDPAAWQALHAAALAKAPEYAWSRAADAVEAAVDAAFRARTRDPWRLGRHLLRHSDVATARALAARTPGLPELRRTLATDYAFAQGGTAALRAHYDAVAAREAAQGNDHGLGGTALYAQPRYAALLERLAALPAGARVLDYGCGPGHFTDAAARRLPLLQFTGTELSPAALAPGLAFLARHPRANLRLQTLEVPLPDGFDLVLAAEVLEHAPDPAALAETLESLARPGGTVLLTLPTGPWEAERPAGHAPPQHLHHLERADLEDLWGRKPGLRVTHLPLASARTGEPLGCWIVQWQRPAQAETAPAARTDRPGRIDLDRKLARQAPRETLSVCMIAAPQGETLAKALRSVRGLADELIVGIDCGPDAAQAGRRQGRAWTIAEEHGARVLALPSPLQTGFDAARNATIAQARGDWILWIDDDEELIWPERLARYLRPNPYDAYAVRQHHFAVEPGGVLKTDYPCRLFRNRRGLRFYGVVHEHPERALNEGAGRVFVLPDVAIGHAGYLTEEVRRARFARNLPLMRRDRAAYPERLLGRFLWIRDLAHLNRFDYEQQGRVSPEMQARAQEAVQLWRALVDEGQWRLAADALPYYSEAVELLTGAGLEATLALGVTSLGLGDPPDRPPEPLQGRFLDAEHLRAFADGLLAEKTAPLSGRYL